MTLRGVRHGVVWVALAILLAVATSVGNAAAHASLLSIDPPDGTVLATAPATATLVFNEPVSLTGQGARVLDTTGIDIAVGARSVDATIVIDLPTEMAGTYVIAYEVLSADSHRITGSSTFHVGAPSEAAPVLPTERRAGGAGMARIVLTAVLYAAALVAIGTRGFALWWTRQGAQRAAAPAGRVALGAAVVAMVALDALIPVRTAELEGRWGAIVHVDAYRRAMSGAIGASVRLLAIGIVVLLLVGVAATWRVALWAPASAVVIAGFVVEGHTRSATPTWLLIGGDVVHLAAGAAWLGGVAALAVGLRRASPHERVRLSADVSGAALAGVVAVTAAGVAMALAITPNFDAFGSTAWGRAVVIKVILVGGLAVLGGVNRFRVMPRLAADARTSHRAEQHFRRTLRSELALFAVVLAATGLLTASDPTSAQRTSASSQFERTSQLSGGLGTARLTADAVRVGTNEVILELRAPDDTALGVVQDPTVEIAAPDRAIGPTEQQVEALSPSRYRVIVTVPLPGRWEITVKARTGDFDVGSATVTVDVGSP